MKQVVHDRPQRCPQRCAVGEADTVRIGELVAAGGGIVHRQVVLDAGIRPAALRAAIAAGEVRRVRRYWVATSAAPQALVQAAEVSARLACVSAAKHRGWWMPPATTLRPHLHVRAHAHRPRGDDAAVMHWDAPMVPSHPHTLVESVPDALAHIAGCLPYEDALVVWESAVRLERLPLPVLRRYRWRTPDARRVAADVTGLSDSGIETLFASRIRAFGVTVRQQVLLLGHRVDGLIGNRLVTQLDGYAFHSSAADRGRDLHHDRELTAHGYTVLRFTYAEVVHQWPRVETAILRAIAQGLHLSR
ncbi:protein of unknown function DUF559 [Microbacterium laevaniformans OR221]|jgi:very-short-patch-repair endonuclease|nr:protein of unknown function DUF559 [Microbacterium laevaniformans OR221]